MKDENNGIVWLWIEQNIKVETKTLWIWYQYILVCYERHNIYSK